MKDDAVHLLFDEARVLDGERPADAPAFSDRPAGAGARTGDGVPTAGEQFTNQLGLGCVSCEISARDTWAEQEGTVKFRRH